MQKILITGTRAPASMDLIRSLVSQDFLVYSADSLTFPLGRFVKGLQKHFTLPSPNRSLQHYIQVLKEIIIEHHIDFLIPTCEEVFFISQGHAELSKHTCLFCEPFARLLPLHDKFTFNELALSYRLSAPASWLLTTQADKQKIPKHLELVLKPVYTRFGTHICFMPTEEEIKALELSRPFVAQQFVRGKEYCSYAIAHQGEVLIHCCYHPKYSAGPAAGIYFEPADIEAITTFITVFCKNYRFNGQIAFDFITNEDGAFALECNPRITSGFHLLADKINWSAILQGKPQQIQPSNQPYMLSVAMKVHALPYLLKNPKTFISDYQRAKNVLSNKAYPWMGIKSWITIVNIFLRMIRGRKNFHQASTDDIEYNGE